MSVLKGPPIDVFTITESLTAAEELGLKLSVEDSRQIALEIVKTRFPVCVRDHLRKMAPFAPLSHEKEAIPT